MVSNSKEQGGFYTLTYFHFSTWDSILHHLIRTSLLFFQLIPQAENHPLFFCISFLPVWQAESALSGAWGEPKLVCTVSGRSAWLGARGGGKGKWNGSRTSPCWWLWTGWLIGSSHRVESAQNIRALYRTAVTELIDFSHFFKGCSALLVNSASLTHIINPSNCSGIAFVSRMVANYS